MWHKTKDNFFWPFEGPKSYLSFYAKKQKIYLKKNVFLLGNWSQDIIQERSFRTLNNYEHNELKNIKDKFAKSLNYTTYRSEPSTKKGILIIMSKEFLRFYNKDRFESSYFKVRNQQNIYIYDLPKNNGWKQFLAFHNWQKIKKEQIVKYNFTK